MGKAAVRFWKDKCSLMGGGVVPQRRRESVVCVYVYERYKI